MDADRLLAALNRQSQALLRQTIPDGWSFAGDPIAFMHERYVRAEAGWPDELARNDIPLSSIAQIPHYPLRDGRWIVGIDEGGRVIVPSINQSTTPHWLISGTTGSGKTVMLQSTTVQLAADPQNHIVIVDGKRGASFRVDKASRTLFHLKQQVGPVAITPSEWAGALTWAVTEMKRRNQEGYDDRLVIVVDEVQEVIEEPLAREAFRQLTVLGRDAGVHIIAATQHPVVDALGGSTVVRNLGGRFALRVSDAVAARVALGTPDVPAHHLLGSGDAFVLTPAHPAYRTQTAYVTRTDIEAISGNDFEIEAWPVADPLDLGQTPKKRGRRSPWPRYSEIGAGLITAATEGAGRPSYQDAVESESGRRPGSSRADKVLDLCRAAYDYMQRNGWTASANNNEDPVEDQEPSDCLPENTTHTGRARHTHISFA